MLYKIVIAGTVAMILIPRNFWIGAEIVVLAGLLTVFWERYFASSMPRRAITWRTLMRWNERGQSIVEITLMTPLILVALYVPMDFGIAIFKGHITQNAVRDVVRVAAQTDPGSFNRTTAQADLTSRLPSGVTVTAATVSVVPSDPATNCMGSATATATIQYPLFWYRLVQIIGIPSPGTNLTITRTAIMRHEKQPDGTSNILCS
jgi:Flp pilus assembly protein TadG